MFEQAKSDWLGALGDPNPSVRIQHRLLLKAHGSEFSYRRVFDPKQVAVSSGLARTLILGPAVSATGAVQLVIPDGYVAFLEEVAYHYQEASGGSLGSNIPASQLELQVGNEALSRFPSFRLDAFHKASVDGLMFGTLPLGIVVERGQDVKLYLTGGGGSDSMTVRVSLTVRFEPLWLAKAAGLVLQSEP